MRATPAILLLLLTLLAPPGCAFRDPTDLERARSFAPVSDSRVGDDRLADYLASRTWSLPAGREMLVTPFGSDGSKAIVIAAGMGYGSAAAITEDGYLLTAAHCVTERPVVAIHWNSEFATEPRVVWMGKRGTAYQDLALLKIDVGDARLPSFKWSEANELKQGRQIALAGSRPKDGMLRVTFAAGTLGSPTFGRSTNPAVPITYLAYDAPGGHGDSGGPLVTTDGRLVAIVIGLARPPFGLGRSVPIAARPDLTWLEGLIAADRTREPGER